MSRHMLLYRGSLKSCNYRCSYCPFSKHPQSQRELEKDREQWQSFLKSYPQKAAALNLGALMVVPYGEAMLYPWYWEGLAQILAFVQKHFWTVIKRREGLWKRYGFGRRFIRK